MLTKYMAYSIIAVVIFTIYFAVVNFLKKDRNKTHANRIYNQYGSQLQEQQDSSIGAFPSILSGILMMFGINYDKQHALSMEISRAGYSSKSALIIFLFFKKVVQPILLVIGVGILVNTFVIKKSGLSTETLPTLLLAFIFVVIGAIGAKMFIDNRNEHRKRLLTKTFPEALDLLLICVESGLGIDAAFGRVCKEIKYSHPLIASELEKTRFEMNVMNDRIKALENFASRNNISSINTLVSSLVQAEKFGTSLVDTLRMISDEQRSARMLYAENKAAKLPVLITIPLILFIMPALFMVIMGPVIVKVTNQGGVFGSASSQ